MIDLETGRFTFGDGYELYQGMTFEEFQNSKVYKELLANENLESSKNEVLYPLKEVEINNINLIFLVHIDSRTNLLDSVIISTREFYSWYDGRWPKEARDRSEFEYEIGRSLDAFLANEVSESVKDGKKLELQYPWGSITSSFRSEVPQVNAPDIKLFLLYNQENRLDTDYLQCIKRLNGLKKEVSNDFDKKLADSFGH